MILKFIPLHLGRFRELLMHRSIFSAFKEHFWEKLQASFRAYKNLIPTYKYNEKEHFNYLLVWWVLENFPNRFFDFVKKYLRIWAFLQNHLCMQLISLINLPKMFDTAKWNRINHVEIWNSPKQHRNGWSLCTKMVVTIISYSMVPWESASKKFIHT